VRREVDDLSRYKLDLQALERKKRAADAERTAGEEQSSTIDPVPLARTALA
jgi:hypothetical protein